jgi:hypothetical protein
VLLCADDAKAHDVCFGHAGEKIAEKRGQGKETFVFGLLIMTASGGTKRKCSRTV